MLGNGGLSLPAMLTREGFSLRSSAQCTFTGEVVLSLVVRNRSRDEMKLVESSFAGWRMESNDFSARVLSNEKWRLRISPTVT